jgi:hypothetical protein
MSRTLIDYYRCPPQVLVRSQPQRNLSISEGFFTFGDDAIGYGRCAGAPPSATLDGCTPDLQGLVRANDGYVDLPFDLAEVIDNLRRERYLDNRRRVAPSGFSRASYHAYYFIRPLLSVAIRKHLQRARLRDWRRIPFPLWPVDASVDLLAERALGIALSAGKNREIPFVWFWPNGASACATMTHDVEAAAGLAFCPQLMDLDESFGIRSAFQLVPEGRYHTSEAQREEFRRRGFELNVHDLNHDGRLFYDRAEFRRRAQTINAYGRRFGSCGFRSGAMYRNQDWYGDFEFSYDMSVPNVAHLEPQRGGCCTVMPFFVGEILEIPLTTIQDYSLFHILNDYSTTLWRSQTAFILKRHGLMSFIGHPDYLIEPGARSVYSQLLAHLSDLRANANVWIALPREIDQWWRERSAMTVVRDGDAWCIDGPGRERARLAYATIENGVVTYRVSGIAEGSRPSCYL